MVSRSEYHTSVGGRRIGEGRMKFEEKGPPKAEEIRDLILELRSVTGLKNGQIAKHLGCSNSTITRLTQGRGGDVIGPTGISTTDLLYKRMKKLLEKPNTIKYTFFTPLPRVLKLRR